MATTFADRHSNHRATSRPPMQWPRGRSSFEFEDCRGELGKTAKFSNSEAVLIVQAHDGGRGASVKSLAKIWSSNTVTIRSIIAGRTYSDATQSARMAIAPLPVLAVMLCPWCGCKVYAGRSHRTLLPIAGKCGNRNCRRKIRLVGEAYVKDQSR